MQKYKKIVYKDAHFSIIYNNNKNANDIFGHVNPFQAKVTEKIIKFLSAP